MPRGRGGKRQGTPGTSYPNRTDLAQPVRTGPSKSYGQAAESARAQDAVPLPALPTPSPGGGPAAAAGMPAAGPLPGDTPFGRPSDRGAEPITAGLPVGAGAGPSASMPAVDPVVETLRAAMRVMPTPHTAALLEALERRR